MGPLLVYNALDFETRTAFALKVAGLGEATIEAYAVGGLALASVVVIAAALARFRRGKLVLD